MKKRQMASNKQRLAIHELLSQHCHTHESGMAVYDASWDDARVAAELVNPEPDRPISPASIRAWRADNFGKVRTYTRPGVKSGLLAAVLERLTKLEKGHAELVDEHIKLMMWAQDISVRRGYQAPPGRPPSRPPMDDGKLI